MRNSSFVVGAAMSVALATPVLAAAPGVANGGASAVGSGAGFFSPDSAVFAGDRVQLELAATVAGGGRFNAVHHTSSGVFTRLSGYVDCLSVSGNIAVATGVITEGVAGIGVDPVGTRVSLRITDGAPDVFDVDLEFFSGHAIAPCSSDPILSWSVEQGNFTVRD
jgi:hypothetical protein